MGIRITELSIGDTELIDDSPYAAGRRRFWNDLRRFMSDQLFSTIQFEKISGNALAYYQHQCFDFDVIHMPEDSAVMEETEHGRGIRFKGDRELGLFLHEASHYLHMVRDSGRFTAPSIDLDPVGHAFTSDVVPELEYEAGYRSLLYSRIYRMFPPEDRTVLELNLENMINYLTILNIDEFDGCDPEVLKSRMAEWKHEILRFDEISDFMTVI